MKLRVETIKVIRFDINPDHLDGRLIRIYEMTSIRHEVGTSDHPWINYFMVRWKVNIVNKITGEELIGFTAEKLAHFKVGTKEEDLRFLELYLRSIFLYVKLYFQANIPHATSLNLTEPLILSKKAKGILNSLAKLGFYE